MMQNQGPYPPHYGHGAVPLMAQTSPADRGGQDTLPHPGPLYCPPGPQLGGYAPGVDLMSPTQRVHPVLPPPGQQMNYLHSSPLMYGNYEQFLHQQHTPSTPSHIAMPPIFSPEPPHFTTSGGGYNYSDPRLMSSQAASSIYTSPPGSLPSFQSLQVQTAMSHPALSSSSSQPLPYGFGSPHYSGYHPASSLALPTTPAIAKETVEQQQQPPHRATANTTDLFEFIMKPSSSVATSTITTTTTTLASSSSVLQTAATVSNSRPAVVSSSSLTQPTQSGTNDGPSTLYADPNSSQLGSKAIHTTSEPPPLPPQDRINTLSPASSGMTSPPYSTTSGSSLLAPQLHGSYEPLPPPPPTSHQNHQLCLSSSGMGNYGSIAAVSPDLDDRVSAFEKALLNFQHMELSAVPPQSLARYGIIEEPQLVGDKFFCKKCNYYTTRVDKVLQHLKAHRGNITCDICGKAFLKRADKVRHMVCHTSPSLRGPKVMKGACSSSAATDVNNHSSSVLPPSDSHSRLFSSSSPQHQLQKNEDLQHGSKYSTAMSSYNTYPVTGHSDTRENDRASTTNTQLERSQLEENTEAWRNRKRNNGGMERVVDTNQASEIRNSEVSNMAHDDFSVFKLNKKQRKHQHHKTVLEDNSSEREDNNNIQNGHPRHRGATGVKLWVGDDAASEGEEGGGCNEIILLDESLEENGSELCGSAAVVVKEEAEEKEEDGYGGENRSQEDEDGEDCIDGSHNAKRDRNRRRNSVLNNSDTENSGGRTHSARSNMNKVSSLRQLEGRNEEDNAGSNREEDDEQYSDYRVTSDMPTLPDAIETVAGINGRSDSIDSGDLLEVKRYKTPIFQYEGSRSSRVRNSGANTVNPSFPEPQAIEQAMTKGPRMQDFNINSLRCIYCSYTGSSPRHLAKHYKAHATSYKICRFCNKAFERPSDLVRHEQRHIRNQTIFGSEDIRSTRTGQDTSEVKSIFMRPPITNKRNVLHCRRCGFATTDQHMLNRHLAKSHKQQIFSCEFCTHKFLSEVALYNHIVDCHSAPNAEINVTSKLKKTLKYWTCSICEKTCITRKELAMHFSMAHSNMQGSEFATASKPNSPNKEVDFTSDRATWQSIQQRRIEYSPYVYQPPGVYHMPANYEWREGHIQESMAPGLPYGEGGEEAAMSMKMEESLNDSEDLRVGEYRSAEQGGRKRRKSVQSHREDVNEEYSTEFSMAHPSESADGLIDEASSKKSYTNLIGKIRKQVEYQIRQEKSRDSISRECIECPVCGKDFDSFPVCNIHQLVSHSMCSIRVDRYRNNILTGTDLMKAEVVGENEVSLFVDTREKFADASGYKEVPTVSSVQDAKLIGTNIVKSKENSGTKEPQAEQFESDDDNTMDVYSSTEAKQDSLQQTEEPSKNSVGSSEESSKELSYFFNITPDSNVATSTTSKVSASSSHTSVTDGSPDVRVSSITSTAPSTSIQQTSQTRPDVIKPQTISAIAAEVQQINAQIKAVREKEKSPKNAGKQSVETESCKAASKEDGSSKKAIVVSSGQTSATFRKKFSCNPGSAHNLDDLDPDSIVEKLLKKYAKETDQQNQQRPMILQKVSNSSGRSHEVMKFKSAVAPHIRDHSYVTSVSGSLLKSAIKHSISVNKIKNTPQSRAYANKRRTIANSTLAEDIPMIMPTISSVVSLSPEVTGIYPTAPPTDSDASNALPVLNSITDINEFNPDYGVPPLQIQELKIVGSPILNTNMRQQESSYIQPQQVDWTTERDSAKRKIKCKPGPTKYAAFRCHRCSYGTNALHKYRQHEQAHEHAKFVCKVCDKACIKSCDLVRHWVAHNIKTPNGGFKCDSCEFSDADKEILERHMLCHYYVNKRPPWELNNSDPSTYEPIIDGKRWLSQRGNRRPGGRSRKKLRGHYSVSSSSSASTRGQALESAMEEPVKKVPKQLSPVKEMCKVCKKLIPRLLMPYHIREEHDREKNTSHVRTRHRSKYYCPKCGLGFTDSDAMFVHSFLEHDSSDFEPNEDTTGGGAGHDGNQWDSPETDTIKNQFENTKNDDMQGSTSSINEESQFMCTQCNETFVTYYFLDKHRRNVHWKIENKQEIPSSSRHDITCPICFKALSRSYLKDHMRLHTGEKPHQCPKCSASFAMLQYLQLHLLKKHKCRLNRRQLQSPPPAKSQRQSAAGDDRAETELPMATDASEDFENSTVTEDQVDDLSNQNYDTGQDSKSPGPTSAAAVVKVLTADDGEAEMAAESSKKKRRVESEVDTSATEDIENNDEGS